MKLTSLLIAALALPLAAFAADPTFTGVDGDGVTATSVSGISKVTVGDKIIEGESVECSSTSTATILLPNGGKVVLAPGSRVLFRAIQSGTDPKNYSYEIVLLRGSISGNAGASSSSSSFNIVTTAGVADVSKSSDFSVNFAPSTTTTGGQTISSGKGVIGFTPTGSTATVQIDTGKQTSISPGATGVPEVRSFVPVGNTGGTGNSGSGTGTGNTGETGTGAGVVGDKIENKTFVKLPDFSRLVISPNGN